jgi:hypothetical protein
MARLCLALAALLLFAPAAQARDLRLGIFDGIFSSPDAAERATWLDRTKASGGSIVRIGLSWPGIAPRRPAHPTDPSDPAYAWAGTDAAVADARARGLTVLLSLDGAPRWAEGPRRPKTADIGSWKPNAKAVGAFMAATARRYQGQVSAFQIWNEPNLDKYLSPQWVKKRGRFVAFAPTHYRKMLNAAYAAIKRVSRRNLVVTAGTGPYGDPQPGGRRIMPVRFWRNVLKARTRFDALSHHPYAVAGPFRRALNPDDAALPDLVKLRRLIRGKRLWVTEVSWDSSPPDPYGVPAAKHARWLAEGLYVLWRQRVDTVLWYQVRDQPKGGGYEFSNQSGLYLVSGQPKRAQGAYAFPFVARRERGRTVLWGLRPQKGQPVTLERRVGSSWSTVATLGGSERVFTRSIRAGGLFRARSGGSVSLTARARA